MEYDGYVIGPVIRQLRLDRKLTLDQVSELTGLSISSIKQLEQGGRNLSMKSLFLFMEAYKCDANTILNISMESSTDKKADSIDECLNLLPGEQNLYLKQSFMYMIEQAKQLAS